jgi:propionyl-CoA synthetase
MEEVVADNAAVAECAVIGIACPLKGQKPIGLVVLKNGVTISAEDLQTELVSQVRQQIGPVADFKTAIVVERLPKTRSGKILRKLMRQIADGEAYSIPSTIEDPDCLAEIEGHL